MISIEENATILIVDDNNNNLQVLGSILKEKQYKIALAKSGQQVFELMPKIKPDIILLDVMMPEMDGFEVCRQLKQDLDYEKIPIIFITARTDTESIVEGFKVGGVDYITKPFNSAELLARLQTHLDLKFKTEQINTIMEIMELKASSYKTTIERLSKLLKN